MKVCVLGSETLETRFESFEVLEVRTVSRASHKEYCLQLHFVALAGMCSRRNIKTKVDVIVYPRTFVFSLY